MSADAIEWLPARHGRQISGWDTDTMNTRDGLIAAICADPADELKRLVFCDWLEEDGTPDDGRWAEYIRWGCVPRPAETVPFEPQEVWAWVNRSDSLAAIVPGKRITERLSDRALIVSATSSRESGSRRLPVNRVVVRRGFVEEIRCTISDWTRHGRGVILNHPIERVEITDKVPEWDQKSEVWRWQPERREEFSSWLPWAYFGVGNGTAEFQESDAAYTWLSHRCLVVAREQAVKPASHCEYVSNLLPGMGILLENDARGIVTRIQIIAKPPQLRLRLEMEVRVHEGPTRHSFKRMVADYGFQDLIELAYL